MIMGTVPDDDDAARVSLRNGAGDGERRRIRPQACGRILTHARHYFKSFWFCNWLQEM